MIAIIALVVAGGMRLQNYTIFFILLHISAIIFHFCRIFFKFAHLSAIKASHMASSNEKNGRPRASAAFLTCENYCYFKKNE